MKRIGLALAVAIFVTAGVSAQELSVGDAAPKLQVKFVKGDEVKDFAKDKLYVVEFWATWCGPCRTSIPHLTELQKQNKNVTFIGVSVWEQNQDAVKPFVEQMGEKMDYRVAVDLVPLKGKSNDGAMAKTWMQAAGQNGIPSAFIVNGEGKIAWIGHPMQMDKPLADIVAGTWDLKDAAAKHKQAIASRKTLSELGGKLRQLQQTGDLKGVLDLLDQAITQDAKLETTLGMTKFATLRKLGDNAKSLSYGRHLVETVYKDNANSLNQFAWTIVDPDNKEKPDAGSVKLAMQAALRADELTKSKNPAFSDTLAKCYFDTGDAAKAFEVQERAMKLAKGTPFEQDESMKARLEQYRKAAGK